MSWPYVAQDLNGGWYADCEGVMLEPKINRTKEEALQWCVDRLAENLGQARHGCEKFVPHCLLHHGFFEDEILVSMRRQMFTYGYTAATPDWPPMRVVRYYEKFINTLMKETNAT